MDGKERRRLGATQPLERLEGEPLPLAVGVAWEWSLPDSDGWCP